EDPAIGTGDEYVLALVDRALVQVARDDHVREVERVRPLDLDLFLDADVPQRDAVHEVPVLGNRVSVVARVVGVVVDAVARHPVLAGRVEVRRLADPRVEEDPRVVDDAQAPLLPCVIRPRDLVTPSVVRPWGPTTGPRRPWPGAARRSTRPR